MKVLCIAPHPDDETLGCGGTLLRHIEDGDAVHWLIVTAAVAPAFDEDYAAAQNRQIDAVAEAYGFAGVVRLGLPAAGLDQVPERDLIGALREQVDAVAPAAVYINHRGDAHSDHRITFDCAMAALKPFRTGPGIERIVAYETLSETEQAPPLAANAFLPNSFVAIGAQLERKLEILELYGTELQPFPLPREAGAVRALARLRGAALGVEYAEAFMVMREVR